MTPEIITRSFSNDQAVFDRTFFENAYKIKGCKDKKRTFVDIGAHAGFFSFSALSLGASKVYSFEPYIDSFNLLLRNCYTPFHAGRITPYMLGVYTNEMVGHFTAPELVDGIFFDFAGIGLTNNETEAFYPCPCVSLDKLLTEYCFNEEIHVLKINIGYAEKEILTSCPSRLFDNVHAICGETEMDDQQMFDFKKQMGIIGFVNFISAPLSSGKFNFWMSQDSLSEYFVE